MATYVPPLQTCATCGQPHVITPSGYLACTAWHGRLLPAHSIEFALRHWTVPLVAVSGLHGQFGGYRLHDTAGRVPGVWAAWPGGDGWVLRCCYVAGGAVLGLDGLTPRIFVRLRVLRRVKSRYARELARRVG